MRRATNSRQVRRLLRELDHALTLVERDSYDWHRCVARAAALGADEPDLLDLALYCWGFGWGWDAGISHEREQRRSGRRVPDREIDKRRAKGKQQRQARKAARR